MGKLMSTNLASLMTNLMLRNHSSEASWRNLLVELKKETPITLSLLVKNAHVKRQVHKLHGED